jgi:hypothetical protein
MSIHALPIHKEPAPAAAVTQSHGSVTSVTPFTIRDSIAITLNSSRRTSVDPQEVQSSPTKPIEIESAQVDNQYMDSKSVESVAYSESTLGMNRDSFLSEGDWSEVRYGDRDSMAMNTLRTEYSSYLSKERPKPNDRRTKGVSVMIANKMPFLAPVPEYSRAVSFVEAEEEFEDVV